MSAATSVDRAWDPGFAIAPSTGGLGFRYGAGVFGPEVERRSLDAIRPSLRDPDCDGPDPVYAIAMDVGEEAHRGELTQRHLLYGCVAYAAGRLGDEPIRSQGHVHRISPRNGWSTPELYEVWSGQAVILMQESDRDDPGRCFAVTAGPGEVVVVPPAWAHATVSADPSQPLVFGAWCDRGYGFVYDGVRAHGGLAHFPRLTAGGLTWAANPAYSAARALCCKRPRRYRELGLEPGVPIYRQWVESRDRFAWIPDPQVVEACWRGFVP